MFLFSFIHTVAANSAANSARAGMSHKTNYVASAFSNTDGSITPLGERVLFVYFAVVVLFFGFIFIKQFLIDRKGKSS